MDTIKHQSGRENNNTKTRNQVQFSGIKEWKKEEVINIAIVIVIRILDSFINLEFCSLYTKPSILVSKTLQNEKKILPWAWSLASVGI